MEFLRLGIILLVVGVILSLLPTFGVLAGPLIYIGWVLIVIGLVLAIIHVAGRSGGGRSGRGRAL